MFWVMIMTGSWDPWLRVGAFNTDFLNLKPQLPQALNRSPMAAALSPNVT